MNFVLRQLFLILIWIGLLVSPLIHAAQEAVSLPNPQNFSNTLELGDIKQAKAWLDAGLDPNFMGSRIGSGLMIGAWEGNLEMMRLFISRGASIDQVNENGETALLLAAWRGKLDAVKWLLERGAPINAPYKEWSALHYAVFAGNTAVVDYLIEQGADIDALSSNGSSVLMMAIYEGKDDLARKLIEKGADRTFKNDWGEGAFEWAMRYNHLNIARMLTNPEEFNIAVSQPKEKWGDSRRSLRMSKTLESLLEMREKLRERGQPTENIDKRITAERMRIVRNELDRRGPASKAVTFEITADRKQPEKQSARIIHEDKTGAPKAPPVTFTGKPRPMPPKGPVKNY